MAIEITMPRLSDTMEEGTINKWHVQVGDTVSAGDTLADVETDKATMELEAYDDGTLAGLFVEAGATTAVGQLIAVLAEEGEDPDQVAEAARAGAKSGGAGEGAEAEAGEADAKEGQDAGAEEAEGDRAGGGEGRKPAPEPAAAAEAPGEAGPPAGGDAGRVRVSPVATRMAEEHGIDLGRLEGSGPEGRIIKRDVQRAIEEGAAGEREAKGQAPAEASAPAAPAAPEVPVPSELADRRVELTSMRKTIARRLVESKTTIPHFTVTRVVDLAPLAELRKTLNAQLESQGIKLSVNDFIVRAVALSLTRHPYLNASFAEDAIQLHGSVNVGVAVALPEEKGGGLVVPVLRETDRKGLRQISAETRALAKKARTGGLSSEEMSEGTFTISNLGMYPGIEHFEAIINPPQSAILAVGSAMERPVVRNGQIEAGLEMSCTLSCDHRVVDGALGAEYLKTLGQMLEQPAGLLV